MNEQPSFDELLQKQRSSLKGHLYIIKAGNGFILYVVNR
jgi:hypothetical protein